MHSQNDHSLATVAQALHSGDLSLHTYLDELEERFQNREPEVLAFLPEEGRFQRLRREAQGLFERYQESHVRPPLFGVPVGVKDIFHVDGFETQAGSQVPAERIAGPEAKAVTQLKTAGALILGKTVTTEFAYFAPGPTRNPHNSGHTPGGSSSGSAAAVGAAMVPLALGTQTIGSITRPAAFCGIFGYKPSYERISRDGVIPLSPSSDHVGILAADLSGIELAAAILIQDWQPVSSSHRPNLGVPAGPYLEKASAEGLEHFWATCQHLEETGYQIEMVEAMSDFEEIVDRHNQIVAAEAAQVHEEWFAEFRTLYHSKTAELIHRGQSISQEDLSIALDGGKQLRQDLIALMDKYNLELWISPAAPGPAPLGLDSTGDPVMNLPWSHSGLPTMNLPTGFNAFGLPLGLQIAAGWFADEKLVDWSAEIFQKLSPEM